MERIILLNIIIYASFSLVALILLIIISHVLKQKYVWRNRIYAMGGYIGLIVAIIAQCILVISSHKYLDIGLAILFTIFLIAYHRAINYLKRVVIP